MLTSEFDFDLPETAIALRPVKPRDAARMLVVPGDGSPFADRVVRELPDVLAPGDLLILNDTRVVPARLEGVRHRDGASGAHVEATLAERLDAGRWTVLAKPAKRLRPGDRVVFAAPGIDRETDAPVAPHRSPAGAPDPGSADTPLSGAPHPGPAATPVLSATVAGRDEGFVTLAFDVAGPELDAAIARVGRMPLPPYIEAKRAVDAADRDDYQTVFAREAGAVAAPTAGLHLTPELLARLEARGVGHAFVTLHVGAGTFLPVKAERTEDHRMHSEHATLTEEVAARIAEVRAAGGRIVAVGTTALRVIESAAGEDGVVRSFHAPTDIFITPGYRFRAVDVLMTNFHLPRSTLFMLVSAFAGLDRMRAAYAHAIAAGYRFYSYGDASLLFRVDPA